ncbi:GTP-binding protein SAR1 [Nematocida displodere]|uniref:Small COPII coat GTPase SAR1 n=1 Tax=Nematocida displodere TaxID=1805483 RepID=A0A177ELT1_9MICR|nr:GTP-binding protein SAR1 [Nematocida displodere]
MEYIERGKQFVKDIIHRGPIAFFETIFGRQTNILFLGIDNAGKTTLLLRLKTDSIHTVAPTLSVREETLQIGNMKVTISDLGGHETARLGWGTYFVQSQGIVFMIDVTDEERYPLVKETYHNLLHTIERADRKSMPVAVLFNKTDKWQKCWEMKHPGHLAPPLDEPYLHHLCQMLNITTGDGEDGRRISANYCSVVTDSISDQNKGFMLAFKWLDMMIRNTK